MRQTSQAVLLLLGAASGAASDPDFLKSIQAAADAASISN
jgi:hypothetical protein